MHFCKAIAPCSWWAESVFFLGGGLHLGLESPMGVPNGVPSGVPKIFWVESPKNGVPNRISYQNFQLESPIKQLEFQVKQSGVPNQKMESPIKTNVESPIEKKNIVSIFENILKYRFRPLSLHSGWFKRRYNRDFSFQIVKQNIFAGKSWIYKIFTFQSAKITILSSQTLYFTFCFLFKGCILYKVFILFQCLPSL